MAEGRVVHENVGFRDALLLKVALEDVVRRARIDVVGAEQGEFLDAQFLEEIVHRRNRLLVRRGTGVEDVLRALLALILHRVEQEAVQLLDHRQHRLAADRGPAAEDHVDIVHGQQFARLLGEERPVGGGVHHHRLELLAQKAALGVLLIDEHQDGVLQRRLGNRHRARERMEHADLDRVLLRERPARERQTEGRADQICPEHLHALVSFFSKAPPVRSRGPVVVPSSLGSPC